MPGVPENSSDSAAASARITVTRNAPDDVQMRQVVILLDGHPAGELLFGDSLTIPVVPGQHLLRVDNTWNHKQLEVDVRPGDHLQFLTKSTTGQFSRFLLVAFGAGPIYVSIEPVAPASS